MHGQHSIRVLDGPEISGINSPWRPCVEDVEKILGDASGYRGKSHSEIAASLGVPEMEFSAWLCKMRVSNKARPNALPALHHLLDLRKAGSRIPSVTPADVLRRADSLARADALAKALPVWPNPPLPEPRLDSHREIGDGYGFRECSDGVRVRYRAKRASHGPHARRAHRDDGDGEEPKRICADPQETQKPVPVQPEPAATFPLVLAACLARDSTQFAVGDAIVMEVGPPSAEGIHDGSSIKLKAASKYLADHGIAYRVESLKVLRRVAFAYPADRRRPVPWTIHFECRTPEMLDEIINGKPADQKHSAEFCREELRRVSGAVRNRNKSRPRGISRLMARMIAAFKNQGRSVRVAVIVELMRGLGLVLSDLDITSCSLEAARQLAVATAAPVERAVA